MESSEDSYFYSPSSYLTPPDYEIPPIEALSLNSQHPELNTVEYRYKVANEYREPKEFLPVFAHIDSKGGKFVVATNAFTEFQFGSTVILAPDFEIIRHAAIEKAKLLSGTPKTVLALKLLDENLVS